MQWPAFKIGAPDAEKAKWTDHVRHWHVNDTCGAVMGGERTRKLTTANLLSRIGKEREMNYRYAAFEQGVSRIFARDSLSQNYKR